MSEGHVETAFERKLRERREAKAVVERAALDDKGIFPDELIPDIDTSKGQLSDADHALDAAVEGIDIIDAYRRWVGKMVPDVRAGQTESIMISCPVPGHEDRNPSAWLSIDKQTWYCAACTRGGDMHDFAAWHFGYDVPGYKQAGQFGELRKQMAADFGYTFSELPGGAIEVIEPEPEVTASEHEATMAGLSEEDAKELEDLTVSLGMTMPKLNWQAVTPPGTFLDEYMKCCIIDDSVDEFHFFNGLMAIGMALGRQVALEDSLPVFGNLFMCALGKTGEGKSKARSYMSRVIREALPHDKTDPFTRGSKLIQSPASAESLIMSFNQQVTDPSDPKKILGLAEVRGVIDFNELSSLMSRTNRSGSALKPTLMEFYDMSETVSTTSITTGVKEAFRPYASLHTTSQLRSLRDLVNSGDDASGFLNRWVFVLGPAKKRFSMGGRGVDVTPAVTPLKRILAWGSTFKGSDMVTMSPEGLKVYDEFFHSVIAPTQTEEDHSLFARLDLLTKKLMLLLAANKHEKVVSVDTVREMMKIVPYLIECYSLANSEIIKNEYSELANEIRAIAARQYKVDGGAVTMRQISKTLWRKNVNPGLLASTVDNLVKLGMLKIKPSPPGSKGRPTVRYEYVV